MTVKDVERIGAPEISRGDARRAFLEYRRAVVGETDPKRRQEYEGLMRGYRAIANGQQVIDLHQTMATAGVQQDTLYPRLAICRADAKRCRVQMAGDGGAVFVDDAMRFRRSMRRKVVVPAATFPLFTIRWDAGRPHRFEGGTQRRADWKTDATAIVPLVPPQLHPRAALVNYHILWDAVWTPAPPRDPLLLRHLAGSLFAIVAHWDLSPLEQAVLRGRL